MPSLLCVFVPNVNVSSEVRKHKLLFVSLIKRSGTSVSNVSAIPAPLFVGGSSNSKVTKWFGSLLL